jgi:hypothetical protein
VNTVAADRGARPARARPAWRAVAIPDEHGGWGLTAEPVLLGLLVAPSWTGAALGLAAFVAFLVRSPLKIVLVDRRRGRRLDRTRVALRIAGLELAFIAALTTITFLRSGWTWLLPLAVALPLVGIELWFDMRSRSRRLIPELCGAIGITAFASSIALAGGVDARLAVALWLILAARGVASIPFVRVQIDRLRHGSGRVGQSDGAQLIGVIVAAMAVACDTAALAGVVAVVALACAQVLWIRRPPVPAKVLGLRQLLLGIAIVAIAAVGVHA